MTGTLAEVGVRSAVLIGLLSGTTQALTELQARADEARRNNDQDCVDRCMAAADMIATWGMAFTKPYFELFLPLSALPSA